MISIVIPLFNKGTLVNRTINSILVQSYGDFEIIIVDDGSTDNSKACVLNFSDKRIKYYYKENEGVSIARNFGLNKCSGEWVMFLDSDDILCKGALKKMASLSERNDIQLIVGNFYVVEGADKRLYNSHKFHSALVRNPIKNLWKKNLYCRPGNFIVKRNVISNFPLFKEGLSYSEDTEFGFRLLSSFSCFYVNYPIMEYIKDPNGASMHIHPWNKDFVSVIDKSYFSNIYSKLVIYEYLDFEQRYRKNTEDIKKVYNLKKQLFDKEFVMYYYIFKLFRKIRHQLHII